jgi:hypothetical protein
VCIVRDNGLVVANKKPAFEWQGPELPFGPFTSPNEVFQNDQF